MRARAQLAGVTALVVTLLASASTPAAPCAATRAKAADLDWAYWNAFGVALSPTARPAFALGFEGTLQLFCYRGFPASRGSIGELRFGPWAMAQTTTISGLVEGGLKLHLGALGHAQWGTYDLRLGSGYGAFDEARHPHGVLTLAWGARAYLGRGRRSHYDPAGVSIELARPWRVFGTYRRALDGSSAHELVFGLEITPAFALPPRDSWQLIGESSH